MSGKQRVRLTDSAVARLRPREREYTVWDTRTPGLGVRVRPSGGASFVLLRKTDGRTTRLSLGPVTSRSVDDARRQCHALMAKPHSVHPTKRTHNVPPLRDFVDGPWKDAHFPHYKPSTRKGVNTILTGQLLPAFGAMPFDRITRTEVLHWFNAYSRTAPGGANHALRILRQILEFAIARGHLEINPARDVAMNRRTALTRFLSRDELQRLHRALDRHARTGTQPARQADIIRLLLLTGCRRGEILALRWSEVDGDTIALADSKTGPRKVYLNAQARRIIERQPRGESPFVFPSARTPERPYDPHLPLWGRVRAEAGIEDVRLHDLRHTMATYAVMNGVPVPVVSRLLGHSSVQMTLRYAHLADRDIEAAAERVGAAMARVMALDCAHPAKLGREAVDRATIVRIRRVPQDVRSAPAEQAGSKK
ncbi:MAG: site-specific integrase [Thiotrichales bacterium]|nr:site-specific integrase [Thiotrichales bacterium]